MTGSDVGLGGRGEVHDRLLGEVDFGTLHSKCVE